MKQPWERWGELDETLSDADARSESGHDMPEDQEARQWLLEQRMVHGLLRTLHTADAEAREARVDAILKGIVKVERGRHVWGRVLWAAAVIGLLAIGYRVLPGTAELPRAEALVAQAVRELGRPVDRRFNLQLSVRERSGRQRVLHDLTLTTRPGRRFLLRGQMVLWSFDAGCDGETVWLQPHSPWIRRGAVPLDEAERLVERMGDMLDVGYLDVQALVERLPESLELRSVGRESPRVKGGSELIRVEAVRLPDKLEAILSRAYLLFEADTGMIAHIEIEVAPPRRQPMVFVFDYQGPVELGEAAYRRPW